MSRSENITCIYCLSELGMFIRKIPKNNDVKIYVKILVYMLFIKFIIQFSCGSNLIFPLFKNEFMRFIMHISDISNI